MKKVVLKSILLCSVVTSSMLANEHSHEKLAEITVTANKVEENINDIPQSISVLDELQIEERGIKTVVDLIKRIPGMNAANTASGTAINFRGLNTSLFTDNNPVVVYINGVPTSSRYDFNPSLNNIERIEILRGPQGTLYGKDAIGAVINIITKEEVDEFVGAVGLEYGSTNYQEAKLNINAPLVEDKLFLSLDTSFTKDDGWVKNIYPGMNKNANRKNKKDLNASLLYKANDRLSTKLTFANSNEEIYWMDGYSASSSIDVGDANRKDAKNYAFDTETKQEFDVHSQALNINYDFDNAKLTSVTTHKNHKGKGEFDADFGTDVNSNGLIMYSDSEMKTITQELRLSSTNDSDLKWVSGLYFEKEKLSKGPYGGQSFYPGYGQVEQNSLSNTNSETSALFGQVMIPLSPKIELTLGGRYQQIKKDIDLKFHFYSVGQKPEPSNIMNEFKHDKKWNKFLPKVALAYKLNDSWNMYASASKGYMPGGFNYYASSGGGEKNSFKPQQSSNYEVGVKGSFENGNIALSAFRMDIKDIHVYKVVSNEWLTGNAKKAHSQGLELEMMYFPSDNWEFNSSLGYTDAKYDDYDAGDAKYDGENIHNTPKYMANFGLGYNNPNGFYARGDLNFKGSRHFYHDVKNKMDKAKAYTVANMKVGYKHKDLNIYTYVNNIFDEEYVSQFDTAGSIARINFGTPRKLGVGLKYNF